MEKRVKNVFEYLKDKNYISEEIELYKKKTDNESLKNKLDNVEKIINNYIDRRCNDVR